MILQLLCVLSAVVASDGGDPSQPSTPVEPAVQVAPLDFSGHWLLDADASQSLDAVLEVQGVSRLKRKLGATLDNDLELTQSTDKLVVVFDNILGRITQELYFDGRPHSTHNPARQEVSFTTSWADDHRTLMSSGPLVTDDGATGAMSERRTLSADGRTMTIRVQVTMDNGAAATVERVFRKQ